MATRLTLAVPKKGRLSQDTFALLKKAGLSFRITDRSLKAEVRNFPLDLLLLRTADIPGIVAENIAEIGITGQNDVAEYNYPVRTLVPLGFGRCSLCLAFPDGDIGADLNGKRIATSYPNLLSTYLNDIDIDAQPVKLAGSIELAPKLGIADLICDLVSTGSTLRSNGLTKGEEIFKSEAVIVGAADIDTSKQTLLDKLLLRVKAVLTAKKFRYVIMNASRGDVPDIERCIPGLKKPTISSLADTELVSIASVIEEDYFWATIEKLKSAGASGIVVLPIEKLVL